MALDSILFCRPPPILLNDATISLSLPPPINAPLPSISSLDTPLVEPPAIVEKS